MVQLEWKALSAPPQPPSHSRVLFHQLPLSNSNWPGTLVAEPGAQPAAPAYSHTGLTFMQVDQTHRHQTQRTPATSN